MEEKIVEVKNLTKIYETSYGNIKANDNISIDIFKGEIFGLLGPNGAGKTTFIKQISGLIKPTLGSIILDRVDVNNDSNRSKSLIGYMGQKSYALMELKVDEAIYFTAHLHGFSKKEASRETEKIIEELDLINDKNKLIESLSGGLHRMVSFAMSVISNPKILILDEPSSGLDPRKRILLWDKLYRLNKEKKTTVILVTHNVAEAERVIERVGIINKGKIIALGTPGELKKGVDQRLRIEVILKSGYSLNGIEGELSQFSKLVKINERKIILFVNREEIVKHFEKTLRILKLEVLDDFRITTASLEDVYIEIEGREINE